MNQHSKPRGVRKTILNSTAIVAGMAAVLSPGLASAQDASAEEEEVIVVTGTRIQRGDYQFSNPVVSSTAQDIQNSGDTNLLEYLQTVPALNASENLPDENYGVLGLTGIDMLNLRNLGVARTLVLVDGRRHVAGNPGTAAVDVSTIPTDLVERVDVLTGGSSAIYGADGVSGVVNFILKDDFEGLRFRVQHSAPSDDGGGQNSSFASATWGANFAEGRGNIAASIEYSNDTALRCIDREYCMNEQRFIINPNTSGVNGPYTYIPRGNLGWAYSGIGGAVDIGGDLWDGATDAPWDFGADIDPPNGVFDSNFTYSIGGSATPTANYNDYIIPSRELVNVNLLGHFDLTDNARVYGGFKVVRSNALQFFQPTFDYVYELSVLENPFIPTNIRDAALLAGEDYIYVSQDHFQFGRYGGQNETTTTRGVIGLQGEFSNAIGYDFSFVHGRVRNDSTSVNFRFDDRFAAALDVVDPDGAGPIAPQCRVTVDPAGYLASFNLNDRDDVFGLEDYPVPLSFTPGAGSGCIPLATLGIGVANPAAVDWIFNDLHTISTVTQSVANAAFNGTFGDFLRLPGGEIGWAAGFEWRREALDAVPDQFTAVGVVGGDPVFPTRGNFEVVEAFVEANLPLLRDAPLARELSLDWAHRYSEYSTAGANNTWKFGLNYAPIDQLVLRGTIAQSVRAPNINDLFQPRTATFAFIDDPCDVSFVGQGPDPTTRAANCATLLSSLGVANPAAYVDPGAAFSKAGFQGGNTNLEVETADSYTLGFIFRPSFFNGFAFSADYYDIVIDNAISLVDPQNIADRCVDAPDLNNQFCDAISRQNGGGGAGSILQFETQPFNVAQFTTRGVDFTMAYQFEPSNWGWGDVGAFEVRVVGNNTLELTTTPLPGSSTENQLGESFPVQSPEWQARFDVNWMLGRWTVHYGYNFSTDVLRFDNTDFANDPTLVAPEYKYIEGLRAHEFQVRYELNDNFTFYGGGNNLGYDVSAINSGAYVGNPNGNMFYLGAIAEF